MKDKAVKPKKRVMVNQLNDLTASEWIQETISVFNQKGLGAGHEDTKIERQHPAPFSFQDVGRLIKFFTKTIVPLTLKYPMNCFLAIQFVF